MAHIAVVSIPAPGHVNPSLDVVAELVRRGHRVTYAQDPSFAEVVASTGAELQPYASTLAGAHWEGDAIDHLTHFQADYEAALPQLRDLYENDRPDLFCYDIGSVPARVLGVEWGIPTLQFSPTYVAWDGYEEDMAEFLASIEDDPRGRALRTREREWLRANGVDADPQQFLGRPDRAVVLIARSMQPNADRVDPAVYTFVGPARELSAGEWPEPTRRLLLISLGTAFNERPEFYRRCLQAYGDLDDWQVVLQIGQRTALEDLGEIPENVEVHRWVPQVAVLRHADAFVTHCGMGGSSEGLLTGTPMIAAPQDVDQFENADALVAAGVAVRIDSETATVDELRDALRASQGFRDRSAEIAGELREAGGIDTAVRVVESLLQA